MKELDDITIFKSKNPDEIIVFEAESSKDQIRFYLNDDDYITAKETIVGSCLDFGKKSDELDRINKVKKSKMEVFKENPIKVILVVLCCLLVGSILLAGLVYLAQLINNVLIYMFSVNIIALLVKMFSVLLFEFKMVDSSLKSKHSAEHMMVNFITKNKRLPKNMEEIKKSSRFSKECGSRSLVEEMATSFIQTTISAIVTVGISEAVLYFSKNEIAYLIVFVIVLFGSNFLSGKLVKKYEVISAPIKEVLTNLVQCGNTTSKPKDDDIILAYSVARLWMKIIYPEFYNEEDDVFYENIKNSSELS